MSICAAVLHPFALVHQQETLKNSTKSCVTFCFVAHVKLEAVHIFYLLATLALDFRHVLATSGFME